MTTAVLCTCHGTVSSIADLPAFVRNIRRGRPAPPEVVEEVVRRFERIGGSPLMRITHEQAAGLELRLGLPVRVAGRLWGPYPAEVVGALAAEGVTRLVSLPLAPQSVDVYHAVVREAVAAHGAGMSLACVAPWGEEPALVDAFAETVDEALARFPEGDRAAVAVVLSAHSLPQRVIAAGDPYETQFRAMAAAVAARLGERAVPTRVAFQSQGMTGDAWLGPDLPETFASLVAAGVRDVVVAPIGFVSDHVETLYDLDVEAPDLAAKAGLRRFERAPAVNARPRFVDALEAIARRALA
jgi:ferrochelatase